MKCAVPRTLRAGRLAPVSQGLAPCGMRDPAGWGCGPLHGPARCGACGDVPPRSPPRGGIDPTIRHAHSSFAHRHRALAPGLPSSATMGWTGAGPLRPSEAVLARHPLTRPLCPTPTCMDDRHLMERLWALRKAVDRFTLSPAQMSVGVEAWLADTDFTEDPRVRRLVHLLRQCDAQRDRGQRAARPPRGAPGAGPPHRPGQRALMHTGGGTGSDCHRVHQHPYDHASRGQAQVHRQAEAAGRAHRGECPQVGTF
jgi:hypothetical protein